VSDCPFAAAVANKYLFIINVHVGL